MSASLEEQIVELQMKVQFQEDSLNKLDEVIVQQSDLIDRLTRRLSELEDRLEQMRYEGGQPSETKEEKPPHY